MDTTINSNSHKVWLVPLIQGAILIFVGLWFIFNPEKPLTILILLMGVYWFIDGVLNIIRSVKIRKNNKYWWWQLVIGILSTVAGALVFTKPEASALMATKFLVYYIAATAIIAGISSIVSGIKLHKAGSKDKSLLIGGAISVLFGIILFIYPLFSVYLVIFIIGLVTIIAGLVFVIFAIRIRSQVFDK